ncbi:Acyltransferase [Pseudomonas chlororaphis]|uniref:acyltransferase family protein n=1 Tax=Pseudomonas chlororaphis TaxID=587753 RepID=UPI0039E1E10C
MLGTVRFFMASCVVLFHLTLQVPNIGMLAVNYFYVISGYLITLVLHETYSFGLKKFAANRFLRLYPTYLFILAISILASTLSGFNSFHASWVGPMKGIDIIGNATIIPWAFLGDSTSFVNFLGLDILNSDTPHLRLIPPSWSVGIEISCYALLWLFVARNFMLTIVTILGSIAWHLYAKGSGMEELFRYAPIPAALLPFSLGALAYHISVMFNDFIKPRNTAKAQSVILLTCLTCFLINWYLTTRTQTNFLNSAYYYTNTILAFLTVLAINKSRLKGSIGKTDKLLGDLAYPLFLSHFIVGFIASIVFDINGRGWLLFFAAYPLSIIISIIAIEIIDKPITRIRNSVRPSKSIIPDRSPTL